MSFCNADVINPEPFDYFTGKSEQGLPEENSYSVRMLLILRVEFWFGIKTAKKGNGERIRTNSVVWVT